MQSYTDEAGLTSRANSAMFKASLIIRSRSIPPEVRLVQLARLMEDEPVLQCDSPAAHKARRAEGRMLPPVGVVRR